MDVATLNYLGITLLAVFGLWAFWKGGQSVQKRQKNKPGDADKKT